MNDKAIRVLEFNKIREGLRKYAITESAKVIAENLAPFKNKYDIENALLETKEALDILVTKGSAPFEGFYDIKEALNRANKGGVLSPGEILRVGNSLSCARRFKEFMKRDEGEVAFNKIEDLVNILESIKPLEDDILRAIVSEDEISDKASATLYDIRRSLREKNSSVRDKINSLMKSNSQYLQDNLYTIRGDRYVLPVRAEYKGAVPGLVHDQSSTGATFFIEPMSLVNLNNEIKELMLNEKSEIHRILSEFSIRIQTNGSLLFSNYKILTKLDFIFAKGKYGSKVRGNIPTVNEDGTFEIFGGRHPLIDPKIVVPSDVYIGNEFTTLMITGPNTGGKTVTLKTVGLIHMMGMSGLLIPAKDGSSIGIYEEIFADIGDEQSIEQSLSTFSSHMTNIVKILGSSNKKSLVLLDELGAGTDPIEGAALAISILEELKGRGAKIIATTHYSELKGYALKTPEVENASVEFDVDTLKPTYRLLIGVPGKSNAFEISRRLGLGNNIIDNAKEYLSKENLQFEDLIRDLQEKSILAKRDARDAERIKKEALKLRDDYEEKMSKMHVTRDKAYDEARREAAKIVSDAKDEADDILKAMRELEKLGIESGGRARLEQERKKLKDSLEKKQTDMFSSKAEDGELIKDVTLGMDALLPSLNQKVTIISLPDNRGEVLVEAGIMKISVKLKDLRMVNSEPAKKERKKREVKLNLRSVDSRLDLRGLDGEEACYRTDKYLDEAYLGNLGECTLVHGKGTGILRKAINDMLKRHPHVKSYRLGAYGEGGDGVTIVELK